MPEQTFSARMREIILADARTCFDLACRAKVSPTLLTRFMSGARSGLSFRTLDRLMPVLRVRLVVPATRTKERSSTEGREGNEGKRGIEDTP